MSTHMHTELSGPVVRVATGRGYTGMAVADFSDVLGKADDKATSKTAELYRAIYISHTRNRLTDQQLDALMTDLHRQHAICGISGLLLYKSRTFFEIIEGPQHTVDRTLDRIFADPRHYKMKVMLYQRAPSRRFDGWSMGFRRLDGRKTRQTCYFTLTRRALEERFPRGATKEIMYFLRAYLEARFTLPPQQEIAVRCRVNPRLNA
ncbi:BLUF domain-containing protein [Sagittula sp. NFXS13]|uniref:BLUF domain-containing protein n=1 Tax=Sagittula sp. NFXS13 TaxID=2819095 RepID=UPI0032DFF1A3